MLSLQKVHGADRTRPAGVSPFLAGYRFNGRCKLLWQRGSVVSLGRSSLAGRDFLTRSGAGRAMRKTYLKMEWLQQLAPCFLSRIRATFVVTIYRIPLLD